MAWATPKTNWGVDVVNSGDLNRIEENTSVLHKGNGSTTVSTLTTSGPNYELDIGQTEEVFKIGGATTNIYSISTTGRQPGNKIFLINTTASGIDIDYNQTPPANYAAIKGYGGSGLTLLADNIALLIYDGTVWYNLHY